MKIEVGMTEKEGFPDRFLLRFENGLVLGTDSLLWKSKTDKEGIKKKLNEIVQQFKLQGFEVTGAEIIDD